ncbi:MAG: ankyrin repeat domain-containing protein [Acidobacteriota bacterium]|nr:ankyrin repeat domain-containing protein [Acidobacteriota bacterium]
MDALIRRLGADPRELRVLYKALQQDKTWRIEQQVKNGMDLRSLKVLMVIPLSIISIAVLIISIAYRDNPAVVALTVLTTQLALFSASLVFTIIMDLLGDEDYRVIASWPFRPHSFLLARMIPMMRTALILAAFAGGPAILFAMGAVGIPVITGLTLAVVLVLFSIALVLVLSALASAAVRTLGLERLRLLIVVLMMSPLLLYTQLDLNGEALKGGIDFFAVPAGVPSLWPAALVALSAGQANQVLWSYAALGLLILIPLPILAFNRAARDYTRGLPATRGGPSKARLGWLAVLLGAQSKSPADRVVAVLTLAHIRRDWRFRMQGLMLPFLFAVIALSMQTKMGQFGMFGDPFAERGLWHPAMIWMVLIMVPPIFALPMVSQSGDHKASWLLCMGRVEEKDYRLSVRRLFRRVFLYPYVALLAVFYLWQGVPLHHLAAHLLMLSLLGELMVGQIQAAFSNQPYSLPPQDEELALKLIPLMLMLEIFGGLAAWALYMTAYRWWWAYLVMIALLEWMRRSSLNWGLKSEETQEAPLPVEEPVRETTPLMVAVREGRFHTAKTLLAGGADPSVMDPDGRTALHFARQNGDQRLIDLLERADAREDPLPAEAN